jgi:hypothetical protein
LRNVHNVKAAGLSINSTSDSIYVCGSKLEAVHCPQIRLDHCNVEAVVAHGYAQSKNSKVASVQARSIYLYNSEVGDFYLCSSLRVSGGTVRLANYNAVQEATKRCITVNGAFTLEVCHESAMRISPTTDKFKVVDCFGVDNVGECKRMLVAFAGKPYDLYGAGCLLGSYSEMKAAIKLKYGRKVAGKLYIEALDLLQRMCENARKRHA